MQSAEQHGEALDKRFDLTPRQKFEETMQRPIYRHEQDKARNDYEKNNRDVAYMERWRNGDRVARTEMYLLNSMLRRQLWRSQEECVAWDAAHPFKEPQHV